MLTISRDHSLAIHPRESFWNRTLLLALGLAVAFHAAGLFLFKVKTVACHGSQVILEPISVAMETPVLIEQKIRRNFDEPLARLPPRPKSDPSPPMIQTRLLPPSNFFSLSPPSNQLAPPPAEISPSLTVALLGPFENRTFVNAPSEVAHLPHANDACYTLMVNNRTGEIVSISPLDEFAREMIEWKMEPKEGELLTKGEVEVYVK